MIKIRQQDGYKMVFLLEPKLTFEENDFEDFKDYFIHANQKLKRNVTCRSLNSLKSRSPMGIEDNSMSNYCDVKNEG